MNPELNGHQEFRKEVASWLKENRPSQPTFKTPDSFMEVSSDEQFVYLRDWQQKVYEAGYLGMTWPTEYGGAGKLQAFQTIVNQEMARLQVPFMINQIGLSWTGPMLLQLGSEEQKKQYLQKILSAEDIWCQGFSEPDHGSDLGSAQTRAIREGDEYVVDGSKIWTSLGTQARYMILLARTDPAASNKYQGFTLFLAPMEIPGVKKIPIRKMTGEYGFNETVFEGARIPASSIVGKEGQGWNVAMTILTFERGAAAGQAGGHSMIPYGVKDVMELAKNLKRDGQPVLEDPLIRDQLVKFMIEERNMILSKSRQAHPGLIQERPYALPLMNKLYSSEFRKRLSAFAVELQGANANLYLGDSHALDEGDWQRHHMNAYSATIGGGTSQIQYNILGERVLGLDKG